MNRGLIKKYIIALFCLLFKRIKSKGAILIYHSISDDGNFFSISPEIFEQQITFLKNDGFIFLRAEDLADPSKLKNKSVMITFDDCYENVFLNAVHILERHRVPATFFVPTGIVDGNLSDFKVMNWSQIKSISNNNLFEIGSHGISHERLSRLSDDEIKKEIRESKNKLEEELGIIVRCFSYPYGRYNEYAVNQLEEGGYKYSFGVLPRRLEGFNNFYNIPRFSVDKFSSYFLNDMFKPGYELYYKIRSFLNF